jgi:hypothetical protein
MAERKRPSTLEKIQARGLERARLEALGRDAAGGSMLLDGAGEAAGLGSFAEDDPDAHFKGTVYEGLSSEERDALTDQLNAEFLER